MHEIQRDPNFDQMVDKMTPKVTKEKPSRKRENNSGGGGANGSVAEENQGRAFYRKFSCPSYFNIDNQNAFSYCD